MVTIKGLRYFMYGVAFIVVFATVLEKLFG